MGSDSALQLRQKSRQIPKLSNRLKFSLLVEFEDTHAIYDDHPAGRGLQTKLPIDGGFLTAHNDFLDVGFDLAEGSDDRSEIGGDCLRPLERRGSDRIFQHAVGSEVIHEPLDVE